MDTRLDGGRIIVISPHLDDAVLSVGALIAGTVRGGAQVEILTVFAGDPGSSVPAGPWDRKSRFDTLGRAAQQRRAEDRAACAILGAASHWLDFGDEQYARGGDAGAVLAAVTRRLQGARTLLLPGFPLLNSDHAWLSRTLLGAPWPGIHLALYAEQPYFYTARRQLPALRTAAALEGLWPAPEAWSRLGYTRELRHLKQRAVRCYASQLRQLGLGGFGLWRLLRHEGHMGGEALAWLS